jgi:hypothetical protein
MLGKHAEWLSSESSGYVEDVEEATDLVWALGTSCDSCHGAF